MDNNTYVDILMNTLTKKCNLLDKLVHITVLQEENITSESFDMAKFEETLSEKQIIIDQLNQLDDGFEKVYDHVKEEIAINRIKYKKEILQLQELIKQVTDKSIKLQTLELQNRNKLEINFSIKKQEIKKFKISSQTASNYYKNMPNQHQGQSYFLDKKN